MNARGWLVLLVAVAGCSPDARLVDDGIGAADDAAPGGGKGDGADGGGDPDDPGDEPGRCGEAPTGPVLHVAPSGSDGADCSEPAPCATIARATAVATPGTTILVAPGTYDGNVVTAGGGAPGNPITIRSAVARGATIYGDGESGENDNESAFEIAHPHVRVEGFTITGALGVRNGVLINADDVAVIGNEIHTICQFQTGGSGWEGGAGIDIWKSPASDILIDRNLIHHIGAPGSDEQLVHGMYLASHVTNGRVTNNVIYACEDFGLHPYDVTEASGWQFINNTITGNGRGILQAPGGVTRNNISFDNRSSNYDIRGEGNVLSNNLSGGSGDVELDGVTSGVDPRFVAPAIDGSGDFRLQSGSPALDVGTATDAPARDFDCAARPQGGGIDLGAFEQ